ncbi:MAG TPA: gamma-glutamyltransferase [Bacteroidales bacterium]|jgi:gamma-glutamyltranspeptidase/glutathione hydrolase|nr:gamma-glutamyltransferase [Bacteroidales bacterium]
MKTRKYFLLLGACIIMSVVTGCSTPEIKWFAEGNGGIVAAGPEPSVQAGLEILSLGGNAADAGVATVFNLTVSDFGSTCIGGEVPFMYYDAKTQKVTVLNGMGGAPLDSTAIAGFLQKGIPIEKEGIKVSTVPSLISTLLKALELKGTMSFEQVIAPTLRLLDQGGEEWYPALASTFRRLIETEKNTPGTREEKILAARDRFYKGDIADQLNDYYVSSGAYLRKTDLEAHTTLVEEPVTVGYRGYDIYKCGPWTQGPVLLQSLNLLEHFDLKSMGFFSTDYAHVVAEAMKLAYADRDKYYGDPVFVDVPVNQLLSDEYSEKRYQLIDMSSASMEIRPGDPYNMVAYTGPGEYWPGEHGTTTCAVVDKWGNAVAATPSANGDYGICMDLGIAHNTRLTTFNTQKGHPNCIQPGKRPRITLTPTIVLRDGKPVIVMSIAGGDMQDQAAVQLILDCVEFGMKPKEALKAPRLYTYHTEDSFNTSPDPSKRLFKIGALDVYDIADKGVIEDLKKRNHILKAIPGPIGDPAMIYVDQSTGMYYAATEPYYERDSPREKLCGALKLKTE